MAKQTASSIVPAMDRAPERQIATLVFLDLESTGLPSFMPKRKVNITEVSLIAVAREHLRAPLRYLHKLTFCVRPRSAVMLQAAEMSGLDNVELESCPPFSTTARVIEDFLYALPQPVCLVAHNGDAFDFPLLCAEMKHASPGTDLMAFFCCDSLPAFRHILGSAADPQEVQEVIQLGQLDAHFWDRFLATDDFLATADDQEPLEQPASRPLNTTPQRKNPVAPPPIKKKRSAAEDARDRRPPNASAVRRPLFQDSTQNGSPRQTPPNGKPAREEGAPRLANNGDAGIQTGGRWSSNGKKTALKFNLSSVYERVVGQQMPSAHEAEVDSRALAEICARLGSVFLRYVDAKHSMLESVAPMWEP
ncbi:uncharacterized protein LOC144175768 [Haemaphysalis longicornis]